MCNFLWNPWTVLAEPWLKTTGLWCQIRVVLLLQIQKIMLLFLYLLIRSEQHSINVPYLMLYQS